MPTVDKTSRMFVQRIGKRIKKICTRYVSENHDTADGDFACKNKLKKKKNNILCEIS